MIVLDTSVLVYAVGSEHRLRGAAQGLVAAVAEGHVRATTTVEVVQELVHVRARRQGRRDAVAVGREYATLLAPLLVTEPGDLEQGLGLFLRYERLGAFDAVLAAAALAADAQLVSADRAFADVDGLRFVPLDRAEALRDD